MSKLFIKLQTNGRNMDTKKPLKKDEWGIVLDYLAQGLSSMARSEPIAQLIGDQFFSLLEVIIREGTEVETHERMYIGDGKRDKVKYIRGRVEYGALTASARQELEIVVTEIVKKNAAQYLDFFNKSGSLSTRMHQLELLPGFPGQFFPVCINLISDARDIDFLPPIFSETVRIREQHSKPAASTRN